MSDAACWLRVTHRGAPFTDEELRQAHSFVGLMHVSDRRMARVVPHLQRRGVIRVIVEDCEHGKPQVAGIALTGAAKAALEAAETPAV